MIISVSPFRSGDLARSGEAVVVPLDRENRDQTGGRAKIPVQVLPVCGDSINGEAVVNCKSRASTFIVSATITLFLWPNTTLSL
jgi:hypothetical protein